MANNEDLILAALAQAGNAAKKVPEAVADWLEENVDPETGYVLDSSLTVAGAAADAKAAGDKLGELKSAINDLSEIVIIKAQSINVNKGLVPFTATQGDSITAKQSNGQALSSGDHLNFYDADGNYLDYWTISSSYGQQRTFNYTLATPAYYVAIQKYGDAVINYDIINNTKNGLEKQVDEVTTKANNNALSIDKIESILWVSEQAWERGSLNMTTSAAPTASSYNQAYRARTPVSSPFLAGSGSTVSAAVGFRVMLEFYNETSGYTKTDWFEQTEYVIPDDSTVWALIAAKTESGSEIPLQTLVNGVVLNIKSRMDAAVEAAQYGDIAGFDSVQFISRQGEFSGVTGNKVAAIKAARKNGYDSIRLSICKTADDYVVLSHDSTVTIGGVEYVIADSNYADISSAVDLFSDAVLLCKRLGMTLVVETKYGFSPVSEISTAMEIVAVNGMGKSVIWSSWKSMLEAIQTINPDASLALVGHLSETVINDAASLKNERNFVRIDAYNVNHNPEWEDDYSDSNLILAANKGLPIKVGSVYTKSDLLYWVGKVEIIEVANLINPKKILLQEYLT